MRSLSLSLSGHFWIFGRVENILDYGSCSWFLTCGYAFIGLTKIVFKTYQYCLMASFEFWCSCGFFWLYKLVSNSSWSCNGNILFKLGFLYWLLHDGAVGIHDLAGTSEKLSFFGLYGVSWGHIHGVSSYSTQEVRPEKTTVATRSHPVLCLWPQKFRKISYFGCPNRQVCGIAFFSAVNSKWYVTLFSV